MEDRFGDMWANRYGAFPRERVKGTWAEDLADLSRDELARGMTVCKSAKFPPTLPEFRNMCRPPIDFETSFIEAVHQMHAREEGRDQWSHPAIFWAAVTIGNFDIRNGSWTTLEKRWKKVFQAELDKGEWQPIPARAIALHAPVPTEKDRESAKRVLSSIQIKNQGSKDWAHKIMARVEAGQPVEFQARKMAEEALAE